MKKTPGKILSVLVAFLLIFQIIASVFLFVPPPAKQVQAATQTWPLTVSSNYTFNSDKIEISSGKAQLKETDGWYNSSWNYRKKITIDHTKVGADLTNFPVLINLSSDSDLSSHTQSDGDDILFASSNGTTKLNHEIEKFDNSTGELVSHIKIPSLSDSENTEIYLYYGNDSCSNQQNVIGVWESSVKMVQHLKETPQGTVYDSTSNNNDSISNNADPTTSGQINGAYEFNGTDDYISVADSDSLDIIDEITVEAWVNSLSSHGEVIQTTQADFDNGTRSDVIITNVSGGEIALIKATTVYNTGSSPALSNNYINHSWKDTNGDVYVSTWNGFSVIHSDNTITVYNTSSNPALPNNYINHSWKDTNGDVYVSTHGGLCIIHPDNTTTVYNTTSSPALPSYYARHSWKDTNGDVYVSTGGGGGLAVIHSDNTTTVYNTGSSPALPGNSIFHSWKDTNGDVYVSTDGGLAVIHSDNTTTVYNTTSSPALPDNYAHHSWKDTNGDVYVSTGDGLAVIHSDNTTTVYNTGSSPALPNNNVRHSWKNTNGDVYVSTPGGLAVIHSDNTTTVYNTTSSPALPDNYAHHSYKDTNGDVYVSTGGSGLAIIHSSTYYCSTGSFISSTIDIGSVANFDNIKWTEELPAGTDITLQTRTAPPVSSWQDDFDDGDTANVNDMEWGDYYNSIVEENGILTFSNATGNDAYPQIDTGQPAEYFPAGSIVKARVRMITDSTSFWLGMFTDGWDNGEAETETTNEWVEIEYTETYSFNKIGFDVYDSDYANPNNKFQIDWIIIESPTDWSEWSSVVSDPLGSSITSPDGRYIKYKANFSTTDTSVSPTLSDVTINYINYGLSKEDAYTIGADTATAFASINNQSISAAISSGWNHIALTYNKNAGSDQQKLYVNGELKTQGTLTDAISVNSNNLKIGNLFQGIIDEPRIYNRALTLEEISTQYNNQNSPSTFYGLENEEGRYDLNNPTIHPTSSNSQTFTSLSGFTETATKNGGEIKYQISNDQGTTWYWYNSGWIASNGTYSQANTATEINSNIATFPIGDGEFLFKAYLHSDGSQLVQLDNIELTYINNTPPSSTFDNDFANWESGDITVNYNLIDAQSDTLNISQTDSSGIEYSTDNLTWSDATDAGGLSEGLTGLSSSASPGTDHIFVWDSVADLASAEDSTVYLRIKPNDGIADASSWISSNAFGLDNVVPSSVGAPTFGTITTSSIEVEKPTIVTENGSGLYQWQIRKNSVTELGFNVIATASITDSSLLTNTQYVYDVQFNDNQSNTSNYGTSASKYTLADTPTNLATNAQSTTQIDISVDTFPNHSAGSSAYYFSNTISGANSGWQSGDNTWSETDLLPNTQYTYQVKARNGDADETSYTATSSQYTLADIPTNLTGTAGQYTMDLSVDSFANDTADSSGYYFENTTKGTNSDWIQTNSWNDAGLSCNTEYTYTVKYRNGDGIETELISLVKSTNSCGGGGSGGGTPPSTTPSTTPTSTTGEVDATVSEGGIVSKSASGGGQAQVTLPANALTSATTVTVTPTTKVGSSSFALLSGDQSIVGDYVYDFTAVSGTTAVTTFNKAVTVTLTYTDAQIAGLAEGTLKIYYWDDTLSEWVALADSAVNTDDNTVTATTDHFTYFAILGTQGSAIELVDGDVARIGTAAEVYIIKIIGSNKFKRHIVSPEVFNSYGHLSWDAIKSVSSLDDYSLSAWVRNCTGINGTPSATDKVYEVNADSTMHHLNMTAAQFYARGGSDEAIYNINAGELGLYALGVDVMYK